MNAISSDEALCVRVVDTKHGRRLEFCGQELIMIPFVKLDPAGGDRLLLAKHYSVGTIFFPKEGHEHVLHDYCKELKNSK